MIIWTPKLIVARAFARAAHDAIGQKRKWTGLPYWTHTEAVAELVASVTDNESMISAAFQHDEIEDANISLLDIEKLFGTEVATLVWELTDLYTPENYPTWNREKRKEAEAKRIGTISAAAQTIKLADLINNSQDIVANDKDFAKTYLREKGRMLAELTRGDARLFIMAENTLAAGKKALDVV